MDNNELQHYGVPGMKWGVRKEQYKSFNRRQRKALRAYGSYISSEAIKLRDKRTAGKFGEVKQRQLKNLEKIRRDLEQVLKTKIDDISASSSGKGHSFLIGATSGVIGTTIMGANLYGSLSAMSKGKEALQKYLES